MTLKNKHTSAIWVGRTRINPGEAMEIPDAAKNATSALIGMGYLEEAAGKIAPKPRKAKAKAGETDGEPTE